MTHKKKRKGHPLVTFEANSDKRATALAMLGQSNRTIKEETGLTDCQITYRLHKAKTLQGHEHGYRVQWRNGESPIFQQIKRDTLAVLMADIEHELTPLIIHPTPQTTK